MDFVTSSRRAELITKQMSHDSSQHTPHKVTEIKSATRVTQESSNMELFIAGAVSPVQDGGGDRMKEVTVGGQTARWAGRVVRPLWRPAGTF